MGFSLGDNNRHSQLFLYIEWFNALPVHSGLQSNKESGGEVICSFCTPLLRPFHIEQRNECKESKEQNILNIPSI